MAKLRTALDRRIGKAPDQGLLLPTSLSEWLPEDRLAYFIIDAAESMDFEAFHARYLISTLTPAPTKLISVPRNLLLSEFLSAGTFYF